MKEKRNKESTYIVQFGVDRGKKLFGGRAVFSITLPGLNHWALPIVGEEGRKVEEEEYRKS